MDVPFAFCIGSQQVYNRILLCMYDTKCYINLIFCTTDLPSYTSTVRYHIYHSINLIRVLCMLVLHQVLLLCRQVLACLLPDVPFFIAQETARRRLQQVHLQTRQRLLKHAQALHADRCATFKRPTGRQCTGCTEYT